MGLIFLYRTTRRLPDIAEILRCVETEIMRVQRQDTEG